MEVCRSSNCKIIRLERFELLSRVEIGNMGGFDGVALVDRGAPKYEETRSIASQFRPNIQQEQFRFGPYLVFSRCYRLFSELHPR